MFENACIPKSSQVPLKKSHSHSDFGSHLTVREGDKMMELKGIATPLTPIFSM